MRPLGNDGPELKRVQFSAVNCDEQRPLCQHNGVAAYPSIRLYKPAEDYEEIYSGGAPSC